MCINWAVRAERYFALWRARTTCITWAQAAAACELIRRTNCETVTRTAVSVYVIKREIRPRRKEITIYTLTHKLTPPAPSEGKFVELGADMY